jgi:hypothetical protein
MSKKKSIRLSMPIAHQDTQPYQANMADMCFTFCAVAFLCAFDAFIAICASNDAAKTTHACRFPACVIIDFTCCTAVLGFATTFANDLLAAPDVLFTQKSFAVLDIACLRRLGGVLAASP